MSLHFKSNNGSKNTGKGFYIALGVCLIAIGVAAWTTYDSVVKYANPSDGSQSSSSAVSSQSAKQTEKAVSGVSKPAPSSTASKAVSSSTASKVTSSSAKPAGIITNTKVTYAYPVAFSGKTAKDYSGNNLVKSETLGDLRVHSGTDLSAKIGDAVTAIADGKVTDITKDDLLGNVIVISHSGDITARYCGLGDTALVKKGDTVKAGQKIGSVSTIPGEMVESPHLHLEIKKGSTLVDPVSILTKKS